MPKILSIVWFRQDLRLEDNPALNEAASKGTLLPIYILNPRVNKKRNLGAASSVWLHHSLVSLNQSLNNSLSFFKGDPLTLIPLLCKKYDVKNVFWNRCYEQERIDESKALKQKLLQDSIHAESFNGSLLWEPWEIQKQDQTPYKVFTPFYRKGCLQSEEPRTPLKKPKEIRFFREMEDSLTISDLNLLPQVRWDKEMIASWEIGEKGASTRLNEFLDTGIHQYKVGRNFPAKPFVSRLSPYLHFGEISPQMIWHSMKDKCKDANTDHFLSELGWREFSYSLLYYNPKIAFKPLQKKFEKFPWIQNNSHLRAWQKGITGIPMVDAAMRELWQTGYMHNRSRMIVGSFLVKNLRIHWQEGEKWFWDCLVDADAANNSASWQWIAGCGADAAPYFRIFNPVSQGEKFDPQGDYIRRYIPELRDLATPYLFKPWEAPPEALEKGNVILGKNYPYPILDLSETRKQALDAFASLKDIKE